MPRYSGLTDRLVMPEEDYTLPEQYHFGLVRLSGRRLMTCTNHTSQTNLVDRPSAEVSTSLVFPWAAFDWSTS